jgi:hypothetical protein
MQETIGFNAKILIVVSIDKTFIAQHKKSGDQLWHNSHVIHPTPLNNMQQKSPVANRRAMRVGGSAKQSTHEVQVRTGERRQRPYRRRGHNGVISAGLRLEMSGET